jgi:hypothetical protein
MTNFAEASPHLGSDAGVLEVDLALLRHYFFTLTSNLLHAHSGHSLLQNTIFAYHLNPAQFTAHVYHVEN